MASVTLQHVPYQKMFGYLSTEANFTVPHDNDFEISLQGFIQDFELGLGGGEGKQDGSRMIVACETCVHAY